MLLFGLGLTIPQLFLATALFNAVVAIYIYTLVPEFLLRFIVWILVHSIYRLETKHIEHIPGEGPALLVANHVSFVDTLVIAAACRRPIRFVIDQHYFEKPILSFALKAGLAIRMASTSEKTTGEGEALDRISAALAAGELVCIFPEGRISNDGELRAFGAHTTRILERDPVAAVPIALSGLWGSVFSRRDGNLLRRLANLRLFRAISISAGVPIDAPNATPERLMTEVLSLRGQVK